MIMPIHKTVKIFLYYSIETATDSSDSSEKKNGFVTKRWLKWPWI